MNLRHAAMLALVGWYLMCPPVREPQNEEPYVDEDAPYSEWNWLSPFPDYDSCERGRARSKQDVKQSLAEAAEAGEEPSARILALTEEECFASDDPRLDPQRIFGLGVKKK
jgi:hypothetical protein